MTHTLYRVFVPEMKNLARTCSAEGRETKQGERGKAKVKVEVVAGRQVGRHVART